MDPSAAAALLIALTSVPASAQPTPPAPHAAVRAGLDLGRITTGTSFFDVGAAMWNHLPRMGERMRAGRIDRPTLTARGVADPAAVVFTAQYYDEHGNPRIGEKPFTAKGCAQ